MGKKKSPLIKCTFTSVWSDDSAITTACEYDPKTGEVISSTVDINPDGCLEREYITLPNKEEIEVCPTCHSYVMKTVMNPGIGHDLNEEEECSDPDCESKEF
jgi:hypothetical protein